MHVLVVDDDATIGMIISRLIHHRGGAVTWVTDGLAALDYLQQANLLPDAIVLDIRMPRLMGWAVRIQQRAQARLASIPVIFIGGGDPGDREQAAALETPYLAKPFELQTLWELLLQVVPYAIAVEAIGPVPGRASI